MEKPSTSRKFIDLIFKASSKWANWNPPYQIQVGDYGTIDKKTGNFEKEGNIYINTNIFEDQRMVNLVKERPPQLAPREDVYIVSSSKVNRDDLQAAANIEVPGLANASIKGQWTFGSQRGALLIMAQPRSSYIPSDTLLGDLAKIEALKNKVLVTSTFCCPAYSLYSSSGNKEVVSLALLGSIPVPPGPGATLGGGIEGGWWVKNTTGLFRSARDPDGNNEYTPLYMLKVLAKKRSFFNRRGEVTEREGDDLWVDAQPPWNPLDDDGEEEAFDDTVSD